LITFLPTKFWFIFLVYQNINTKILKPKKYNEIFTPKKNQHFSAPNSLINTQNFGFKPESITKKTLVFLMVFEHHVWLNYLKILNKTWKRKRKNSWAQFVRDLTETKNESLHFWWSLDISILKIPFLLPPRVCFSQITIISNCTLLLPTFAHGFDCFFPKRWILSNYNVLWNSKNNGTTHPFLLLLNLQRSLPYSHV